MASILILEDDSDLAEQWVEALTVWGHSVVHAMTYEEALIEYERQIFDVLLIDLFIRDNNSEIQRSGGVTLLAKPPVDKRYWRRPPLRVVVTGSPLATDPAGSMGPMLATLGVVDVIAKPFHAAALVARIDRLLRAQEESASSTVAQETGPEEASE